MFNGGKVRRHGRPRDGANSTLLQVSLHDTGAMRSCIIILEDEACPVAASKRHHDGVQDIVTMVLTSNSSLTDVEIHSAHATEACPNHHTASFVAVMWHHTVSVVPFSSTTPDSSTVITVVQIEFRLIREHCIGPLW